MRENIRFEIDAPPKAVLEALEANGVPSDSVRLVCAADMNREHIFKDLYVFATDCELIVVEGHLAVEKAGNFRYTKGNVESVFKAEDIRKYSLDELDNFKVEELISSGRLTAEDKDGNTVFIAAFSNFCKYSMQLFCKYIRLVKQGQFRGPDREDDNKNSRCSKCGCRYPDASSRVCPRCEDKGKQFLKIARFFGKYKKYLVIMMISLSLLTAAGIAAPYFSSGFFYDEVLNQGGNFYGQILTVLLIVVGMRLVSQLATMANNYVTSMIAAKVVYDLKKEIFSSIERLSLSFFTNRQTGGLMTQVNSDANTIFHFFCDGVPYFIINVAQVAVLIVLMFAIHPLLAAVSLVTLPLFFIICKYIYHGHRKYHIRTFSASKSMNSMLSDVLTGARVVKAFSKEKEEIERFGSYNSRLAGEEMNSSNFNNRTSPVSSLVLYSGNIIAWAVGGVLCMQGKLSYGTLITFTAYINMVYAPMFFFVTMGNSASNCSAALQRLFSIRDAEPEIKEKPDAVTLSDVKGEIEFKNVDFSYDKSRKILHNVSFKAEAGKSLGIVGRTGAGKSTLVNLIMRLYDAESGEILIDGVNVKDMTLNSIYDNIAIVSQETYLFIGTILDNIRYAKPDATKEEVIAAAKCAGAHEFIMKLPDAYMTRVGFGYKDLSGGERQRISIARAILKNPKILILDEATAAMDTRTERMIQKAITELTRGRTAITIAHRLSTLRDADTLVVIDSGRVAESGSHAELIGIEDGIYNRLYTLQNDALKSAGVAEND